MNYIELDISIGSDERAEIATALLSDLPFEAFEVADGQLKAYIPKSDYAACRDRKSVV